MDITTATLTMPNGQVFTLPKGIVDEADTGYISDARQAITQLDKGLITPYECMVMLLQAHGEWCAT